jgi:hypothetical protein
MKVFLSVAAVLAWVFAAALLAFPQEFYAPTRIVLTPMLATLPQAHGATLFGLGVVNWLARGLQGAAVRPVLAGNLVVQLLSLGVVARTWQLGAGSNVLPGVVIHVVLGAVFAYFLVRTLKVPAAGRT